jgi:spore coat protein A, manganese oxidase
MPLTRRQFMRLGAAAAAGMMLPIRFGGDPPLARAFYQSKGLSKFAQPIRGLGPGGIQVAVPDTHLAPVTKAIHYTLDIGQFTYQLHPSLGPTTLWGYNPTRALKVNGAVKQSHLGGVIVAAKNIPIQLTFTNRLPPKHILPVDSSDNFPDVQNKFGGDGYNAACVHLHGGFVPWISDGGPMAWFTPAASGGKYGPSTKAGPDGNIYKVLNPSLQPGQAEVYYPNQQSARMMWYHDHAHDITRLNAYAGVASAFIIRDLFEASLLLKGLPVFAELGGNEIPIAIQDKIFVDSTTIDAVDPTWPGSKSTGALWYPHVYETPARWDQGPTSLSLPAPSCVPEMFGDTMLANGVVYPFAPVEPRRYRLRILNACQARFLNLQMYVDDGTTDGITLKPTTDTFGNALFNPTNAKGPDFLVIGTEGGFLPKPALVPSNVPTRYDENGNVAGGSLFAAPAERWDILVDFSGFAGKRVILYNDAPAPFPGGDVLNDYFPGSPNPTPTNPGFGPNTRQIMRFDVGKSATKPGDAPLKITTSTNLTEGNDPLPVPIGVTTPPPGVPIRDLTLNEAFDSYGRLIQMLGTKDAVSPGMFGRMYMDKATETPKAGTTEVWRVFNLTMDTHPVHFHLVNCQIISRASFDMDAFMTGTINVGAARPPDPNESGWKETVRMHPGEVTTVIMQFKLPKVPFAVPKSPSFGRQGYEYVWHCHILDHEEHDMMRPLIVMP